MTKDQIEAARVRICNAVALSMRYAKGHMLRPPQNHAGWTEIAAQIADIFKTQAFGCTPRTRVLVKNGSTLGEGDFKLVLDPLDRQRSAEDGSMAVSIIAGLYDPDDTLIASVIGEPISGRLWSATHEGKALMHCVTYDAENAHLGTYKEVRATPAEHLFGATVFLDKIGVIKSSDSTMVSANQMSALLMGLMSSGARIQTGSGGLNTALVANGRASVAGSISLALGGPWDACGALLVRRAGGWAMAYDFVDGKFKISDPLKADEVKILITANSVATMERLMRVFETAMKPSST